MDYRGYRNTKFITIWILLGINTLVFLISLFIRDIPIIFGLKPAYWVTEPWTLLTSIFVHGGLWHILANMLTLYFFGRYLILLLGELWFSVIYFAGGLTGSLLFALLASPISIGVGASGAIFALGGVLTAMRPKLRVFIFPIPVPIPLWAAILGGFVLLSFMPGIAWQAHLGGLILGLVAGIIFRQRERRFF